MCRNLTSVDGKRLVVKEASLQRVLHLHSIHEVIFSLQRELLEQRENKRGAYGGMEKIKQ